jgi:hypothetical protein
MKRPLIAAVASARHRDFQRAAGCCTAVREHCRTLARAARSRLRISTLRSRSREPVACCA